MWDELLEGRIPELAPALHAGKRAIDKEFPNEQCGNDFSCAEFYAHVYGVLGDPSLPVWLGEPNELFSDIESSAQITTNYISTTITGVNEIPIMDVVGVINIILNITD